MKTIKISLNDANNRLDNFLSKTFDNLKKPVIYKAIRNKKIKVNGKKVSFNYKLNENDIITIFLNDDLLLKDQKNINEFKRYDFDTVYEDNNILVVFKHPGLVVHEDDNNEKNTLINQVLHYLVKTKQYDPKVENSFVPSLVNRIDRNTAGLVIVAKNHITQQILNEKIKNHEVRKFYLTKVYGKYNKNSCIESAYLSKNTNNNLVTITKNPINSLSKKIITGIKLVDYQDGISTLEIELFTGRTHQIRAHLNYLGFPIVGEQKYTKPQFANLKRNKYQILISYKLIFDWKQSSGILEYLNKKEIAAPKELIDIYSSIK